MIGRQYKLPILVYHRIVKDNTCLDDVPPGCRPYCSRKSEFFEQMVYLGDNGFKGIPVYQIKGADISCAVGITFDDGLASDFNEALPILEKLGFNATFYIVTDSVGKSGYMDWVQIKELRNRGMEIGSHSLTHRCLLDLDKDTLFQELTKSKEVLEDYLGEPILSFSIPYGFTNQEVIENIFKVGYKTVCTSKSVLVDTAAFPMVYGRFGVRRGDAIKTFKGIVEEQAFTLFTIYLKEESKNFLKRFIGRQKWIAFREKILSKRRH